MPIILFIFNLLFIFNILISVFFYLDLHIMCNVFLDGYLNMMSINNMLNPESSSSNNLGGNNSGSDGNNPGFEGNNSGVMVLIQETMLLKVVKTHVIV